MAKLLKVREFDNITGNPDFADDKRYKYLEPEAFHNLIEFIHEFSGSEDSADALEFMSIKYVRNVGDVVTVKNYVGLIQMKNGYQIQVLPKISFGSEDDSEMATKRVFLKMIWAGIL